MRILYYGVFDGQTWRSEYPILEGLQKQGHTIWTSNFRSYWPWRIANDWKKHRSHTDLIFIQNGIPFHPRHLERFDKPIVLLASEFAVASHLHLLDCPRPPDYVLAHSEQTYQWCQTHNIPSMRIHHAANHHFYKRLHIPFKYDVCFVGGLTSRRQRILDFLKAKGVAVYVTQNWKPQEVNRIYNQSRLILHIHAQEETYLPTRLFEVLPTQGCLLMEDLGVNLDETMGTDFFVSWQEPEDLRQKIQHLSAYPTERDAITAQAHALAPSHTWLERTKIYTNVFLQVLEKR